MAFALASSELVQNLFASVQDGERLGGAIELEGFQLDFELVNT